MDKILPQVASQCDEEAPHEAIILQIPTPACLKCFKSIASQLCAVDQICFFCMHFIDTFAATTSAALALATTISTLVLAITTITIAALAFAITAITIAAIAIAAMATFSWTFI
jgi:hypothetical protein